jgi:voltage-gated potassium channel
MIRILRGVRSTRHLLAFLFESKATGSLACVAMICFVLVVFSAVAILNCETVEHANIKTGGDALWWSFVTMATVGYGDYYPTTPGGRILAAALMTAGIALFGTFTAYVASFFLQGRRTRHHPVFPGEAGEQLQEILGRLKRLEGMKGDSEGGTARTSDRP